MDYPTAAVKIAEITADAYNYKTTMDNVFAGAAVVIMFGTLLLVLKMVIKHAKS